MIFITFLSFSTLWLSILGSIARKQQDSFAIDTETLRTVCTFNICWQKVDVIVVIPVAAGLAFFFFGSDIGSVHILFEMVCLKINYWMASFKFESVKYKRESEMMICDLHFIMEPHFLLMVIIQACISSF